MLKKSFSIPVYHVKGNHDAYGPGGEVASRKVLMPEMAKMAGKENLAYANYSFFHGKDLFIIADYTRRSGGEAFIIKTLKSLKEKPRYVFIAIHTPLIALNGTELADFLAQYDAVVLSGHIHTNYLLQYTKNNKTMTQITVSSWLPAKNSDKQRARLVSKDPGVFKEHIRYQAKKFKKTAFMSVYEKDWEPYLSMIQYKGNGYMQIHVSDQGISLQMQGSDITQKAVSTAVKTNSNERLKK